MAKTKIEWADKVWNPVVGCTPASEGCKHCYAKRIYDRFYQDRPFSTIQLHRERMMQPFHWRNPSRVFVNSMSDLFHPDVPFDFIDDVFGVMTGAHKHTFMVLTKRPERMLEFCNQYYLPGAKVTNIWMGVTVENQRTAEERIPLLLHAPAAVKFISVEPMLGPVDLTKIKWAKIPVDPENYHRMGVPAPTEIWSARNALESRPGDQYNKPLIGLDWVICGGETGPGARPVHPEWVRSLRDQCQTAGVPFFFKSWGEWISRSQWTLSGRSLSDIPNKVYQKDQPLGSEHMYRIGKKAAGRLLDGREWNEFPEVGK